MTLVNYKLKNHNIEQDLVKNFNYWIFFKIFYIFYNDGSYFIELRSHNILCKFFWMNNNFNFYI